ncbi:Spastin [Dactylella cylindrospora]|nr:Spastin [Dactylella cylindrospora]
MRKRLIKRGEVFKEIMGGDLNGYAYRQYSGPVWDMADLLARPYSEISERVVVDYKQYLRLDSEQAVILTPRKHGKKHRRRRHTTISGLRGDSASDLGSDRSSDSGSDQSSDSSPITATPIDARRTLAPGTTNPTKDAFGELLAEVSKRNTTITSMQDLLLLSPSRIPGYNLKEKKWGWLLIEGLGHIKFSSDAFKALQIEEGKRCLIKSLVAGQQSRESDMFDDIIRGKGKGLVVLLHGPPGTGKTLTGECIAEHTESPLYSITGGELGTDTTRVEAQLRAIFNLAKRWKAIVLLDEADVIMMKRESLELERNAIAAVWLRMIEYFEGVLFLTTNRLQDCDDAFRSRIHLTIELPRLSEVQRVNIWKGLVFGNGNAVEESAWVDEAFTILGKLEVNGRVIKNILRTASYFARSERKLLSLHHLLEVIKVELSALPNVLEVSEGLGELVRRTAPLTVDAPGCG